MACTTRLAVGPIDAGAELAEFVAAAEGDGAVVSFCGLARGTASDGSALDWLHLEHHPRLTALSLQAIAQAGAEKFALSRVCVVHRCGAIRPGETIVFVAAASPHRRAAFDGANYLMDRLKTDALFWKREEGPGGSRWIEPTDADHADAARWGD